MPDPRALAMLAGLVAASVPESGATPRRRRGTTSKKRPPKGTKPRVKAWRITKEAPDA